MCPYPFWKFTSNFAQSHDVLKWVGLFRWPNWISYVASGLRTFAGNSTFKNFLFSCHSTWNYMSASCCVYSHCTKQRSGTTGLYDTSNLSHCAWTCGNVQGSKPVISPLFCPGATQIIIFITYLYHTKKLSANFFNLSGPDSADNSISTNSYSDADMDRQYIFTHSAARLKWGS